MLFLHLKTGHIYEYRGLTIMEATWEPGVKYCPPGFPELEVTRCASEFFDGRFEIFMPADAVSTGFIKNGHGQFINKPPSSTDEDDDEHEHFVDGKPKVTHGKN